MSYEDFLLHVFCLIDDEITNLKLGRLRQRGPQPILDDSEVITMELVGELLGFDQDTFLFWYFRKHHRLEFPELARIHRTTFVRQAANLWAVKQKLQQRLAQRLTAGDHVWLVDSFPIPVCRFARATFCRRFAGQAAYGKDHTIRQTFYGFRLHLRTSREGVIEAMELAPANVPDSDVVQALHPPAGSIGIGDRSYWSPENQRILRMNGIELMAPYRNRKNDPDPQRSHELSEIRWMIETIGSQLEARYHLKTTWAKDLWHLCHRLIRKILSHTVAIWIRVSQGLLPTKLATLVN